MLMCYMGASREEREMLINCHITFSNTMSFVLESLGVCDEPSVFILLPLFVLSNDCLHFNIPVDSKLKNVSLY